MLTKFTKVDIDITEHKPKMRAVYVASLKDLRAIPVSFGSTTYQVKADGEFNYIYIDRKTIWALNRFGRKTEGLPALEELHKKFIEKKLHSVEILAEMYAVDENGRTLSLPNFIHYLKGEDKSLHKRIHLGIFDVLSIDGLKGDIVRNSAFRFEMLESNFNGNLVGVLDWICPNSWSQVEQYWKQKVEKEGWEGLVIRENGDTYKAKPNRDIDAVIIGVNKNNKGYAKGLAKSVKVALMREDGNFVELGDSVIPTESEARELFGLTHVKVGETTTTVLVKPLMVVQLNYISLFHNTINVVRDGETLQEFGTTMLARMKSPRVVGYRKDKHVCVEDIGLNQIEE